MTGLRVAVVGAGIGGLTAALALRANGIDATVYEQAHELKALGAGVSIATNGSRILTTLGVGDAVAAIAGPVTHYQFRTWRAEPIAGEPSTLGFGDPARTWCLHRGEFQRVLTDALPAEALRLGRSCVGATEHGDGVRVEFADGTTADADLLVGADGIHSRLQAKVTHPAAPVSEGIMAYRGLIPADRLRDVIDMNASSMWLGPRQSFLAYPVSAGDLLNIVAFVPTNLTVTESWTAPGDVAELADAYRGWDPTVLSIIGAMDTTFRWGIYDREPLDRWSTDRITLLGDSAHAVTPHLGQGANQAIEDAMTLAVVLRDARAGELKARLRRYEDLRMARTRHVRDQARAAGSIYRSTDLAPLTQAEQLHSILDSVAINTYDAERVAQDAVRAA
ncbi:MULTISPECIES: FAD-dependent monooxygenase [Mycolicibacterium]|uniref:FAD-dependent monooxygenase n=1 Tax=Mycolicibacterium TaxID=1866885 RepID=UPI000457774F|nr:MULTISPECIES: FAD-dependent monooxygenase [Mycolicibacterium]MCV7338306.1 FAD-dependent monooxygenase [Mycolicibacterium senegalense]MDR7290766.1 salicylate hydroxylase [Mycolicibacterium senegalense]QZA22325.1 FAD-dependent monooxygenase [Mycolicibacterium senegalense]CDP89159.1 putative salicylate hydroxylase [Mycolicibacterium farcinogenes]